MENVIRKLSLALVVALCVICLIGCGKKRQQDLSPKGTDVPSVSVTVTPTATPIGMNNPAVVDDYEPSGEIYMLPAPYETSQTVTMVITRLDWLLISEESLNEINRILYEKGLDCQIIFVKADNVDSGAQYIRWLDYCEQTVPIDILYSGTWNRTIDSEMIPFVEERFLPLNDYLETDEAESLRNTYIEDEWMSGTINGNMYLVPRAAIVYEGKTCLDFGTYISVNEEYEEYFTDFDGTYASLKAIYEKIGDPKLHILTSGLEHIPTLLGYSCIFWNKLFYQRETDSFMSLKETAEYPNLLKEIYADMCSGVLVDYYKTGVIPEHILAVIHRYRGLWNEGYKEYVTSPDYHELNWNSKYGVSVKTEKKDLALKILSACFSNPDILCLLNPESDREVLAHRSELLSEAPKSELAGIYYEEAHKVLREVKKNPASAPSGLTAGMFLNLNPDADYSVVNPNWNFDEAYSEFLTEYSYYDELCEAVKKDIENWFSREENGKGK